MDAYTDYILQTTNARLRELRQEAAEHALSRATRRRRRPWWARVADRRRGATPAPAPVPVQVRCPACQTPLALAVEELVA